MKYLGDIIDAKGVGFFTEVETGMIMSAINAGPGDGPAAEVGNFRYFAVEHAREQLRQCALRWKPEYARQAHDLIRKIDKAQ